MADIEHASIPDSDRHQPKGASTAANKTVIKSDGSGGTYWELVKYEEIEGAPSRPVEHGWWIYDDDNTSPISLTSANTYYTITNDGAGPNTLTTYGLVGVTNIWDPSTNRFNFTSLPLGSLVEITASVKVNTGGSNHAISMAIEAGMSESPYNIPMINPYLIAASGEQVLVGKVVVPIKDTNTKDNPARLVVASSHTGDTATPNDLMIRAIKNG